MELSKHTYGIWRLDKKKEPGYSHELYAPYYYKVENETNLEELEF